jgi:hypothetical protein
MPPWDSKGLDARMRSVVALLRLIHVCPCLALRLYY